MVLQYITLWLVVLANVMPFPYFVYLFIVSLAAFFARRDRPPEGEPRLRFHVIIPAHDEESGITETVESCLRLDYPEELFEVVVIADNCRDQTAALAREAGATVMERSHPTDRSKGHALKFLFDRLLHSGSIDRLDAVVIIDADTVADPGLLRRFAQILNQGHDWVQAFDTVSNTEASWRTQLMTYSFSLINGVLLLGQTALGLSGGFRGNGMCFSTRGLRRYPWTACGLVEDSEYSWSLRVKGEQIAFARDVAVKATMLAHGGHAAAEQRRRWEFGRSTLKRRMLGPLVRSKHLGWIEKMAAMIELTMPTTVALVSLLALFVGSNIFLLYHRNASSETSWISVLLSFNAFSACGLILYGLGPFLLFSVPWRVLSSLIYFPFYALWKLLLVLHGPPRKWVRTTREHKMMP